MNFLVKIDFINVENNKEHSYLTDEGVQKLNKAVIKNINLFYSEKFTNIYQYLLRSC